jgi:S-adenosylmethionine decarboxylase
LLYYGRLLHALQLFPSLFVLRSHHLSAILTVQTATANLTSANLLELLKQAVQTAGLRSVGELSATFEPQGTSVVLILEESHVALHVWPEECKVSVDIHICDYHQDNFPKAKRLAELLATKLMGTCDCSHWSYLTATG